MLVFLGRSCCIGIEGSLNENVRMARVRRAVGGIGVSKLGNECQLCVYAGGWGCEKIVTGSSFVPRKVFLEFCLSGTCSKKSRKSTASSHPFLYAPGILQIANFHVVCPWVICLLSLQEQGTSFQAISQSNLLTFKLQALIPTGYKSL